jgi:DNA-binding PadR family transcriptional regulator
MTKEQLTQFAEAGVALKIAEVERELAEYHRQWPHLFLSATPPQLLKAPMKNGNGHWPPVVRKARRSDLPSDETRAEIIRAFLTDKPASMREIMAHLETRGISLGNTSVTRVLHQMPDVEIKGTGRWAVWSLKGTSDGGGAPRKRRTLSAAGRKRLSEAMKQRHASGEIARARAKAAKAKRKQQ